MGVLRNPAHERFCHAVRDRMLDGDSRAVACTAAYVEVIYDPADSRASGSDTAIPANARRLANRPEVKARIQELADHESYVASIDRAWLLLQARKDYERNAKVNLDDYLTAPDEDGKRQIDLSGLSRDKLGVLTIETIEPDSGKCKLRGPSKADQLALLTFIERVGGFGAPAKVASTDAAGNDLPPISDADRARAIELFFTKAAGNPPPA